MLKGETKDGKYALDGSYFTDLAIEKYINDDKNEAFGKSPKVYSSIKQLCEDVIEPMNSLQESIKY